MHTTDKWEIPYISEETLPAYPSQEDYLSTMGHETTASPPKSQLENNFESGEMYSTYSIGEDFRTVGEIDFLLPF